MDIRSVQGPWHDRGPCEERYWRVVSSEYPNIDDMLRFLDDSAIGPDDMGEIHISDDDVRNPCIALRIANVPGYFMIIVHPDPRGRVDGVLTLLDCGVSAENLYVSDNGELTNLLDFLDY